MRIDISNLTSYEVDKIVNYELQLRQLPTLYIESYEGHVYLVGSD